MRSKLIYAAIFAVFVTVAAASQWPAAWIQGPLGQIGGGRWSIGGAEGTVWNGSATLLLAGNGDHNEADGGSRRVVQNIRWKLRWNELWRGRLAIDATLERGSVLILIDSANVAVEGLDTQLPASVLTGLIAGPLGRYGWSGVLEARSAAFKCSRQGRNCTGELELLWRDAGVAEIPGPVLGSYRVSIVGEGPALHFNLATLEGRLQLAGRGEIGTDGVRFTGEASAAGADSGALQAQLRTLGRATGVPGKYAIEYRESSPSRQR